MKQQTDLLQVKCSAEIKHYLAVLKKVYKVNPSQFVRDAILEKLKNDVPKLRTKKNTEYCPF